MRIRTTRCTDCDRKLLGGSMCQPCKVQRRYMRLVRLADGLDDERYAAAKAPRVAFYANWVKAGGRLEDVFGLGRSA